MLVLAVALNGYQGGNNNRPAPTRPKSNMNQPGNKSSKQEKSKNESQVNRETRAGNLPPAIQETAKNQNRSTHNESVLFIG